jgi:iron complex outermembrane recepter protein
MRKSLIVAQLWLCCMCLAIGSALYAQPGGRHCNHAIYGVVTDSETMEPLVYANIYIVGSAKGVMTGMNGEYRVEGLCDGPDTLVVSHIGCGVQRFVVQVEENTHFDIHLPHSQSHTDTVHIHDKHADPKPTQNESSMSGKELDKQAGKSLGEAMKNIAGVNALQTGPSIFKPMIHGMHSNRIVIMNNGVRQESQQWGSEHAPEIDPFTATKLTVVKGANGVRYGPDAIAGVILVEPGALRDSAGVSGSLNFVGMSNGWMGATAAVMEGRFKKLMPLAWRLQGTAKRGGNNHTPDYVLANTGMKELNYSAAAGWTKDRYGFEAYYSHFMNDVAIFAGSHIGNLTDLQAAMESDTPLVHGDFTYEIGRPYQHIVHDLIKGKGWFETGHKGNFSFTIAHQKNLRQEFDNHRNTADPNAPQLHYEIATTSAELLWEHEKFHDFKGSFGFSGQNQVNQYKGFFFIPNFLNYNAGLFAIERLVKLRWELEGGIRYDYRWNQIWMWQGGEIISPKKRWSNFSGTVGGLVRVNPHLSIHANLGSAWRPPTMNELYSEGLHHGAASYEIGDSTLDTEQAWNSSISLKYKGHERFVGELGVYYNFIKGYIYQEPTQPATLTIRGAFPTFIYKQVDARFSGVDAAFAWNLSDAFAWNGKVSMVRAQNLTTNAPLVLIPPDRFESGLSMTFVGGKFFHAPSLSVSGVYTRHQNRFPAGVDYALPPSAWFLVNAEASVTLMLGQQAIDLSLGGYNLSNARYRDYMNRFRYYTNELGRNYSVRIKIPISFSSKSTI